MITVTNYHKRLSSCGRSRSNYSYYDANVGQFLLWALCLNCKTSSALSFIFLAVKMNSRIRKQAQRSFDTKGRSSAYELEV
jgi:hypothetical protein